MPKHADKSAKPVQELVRLLEAALKVGADCLELEWEGQDLVAFQYSGTVGIGAEPIPEDMRDLVIREIGNRANLRHNPTGKMLLVLAGKEYEVFVKEHNSFGGSEFTLKLNRTKKGSG